MQVAETTSYVMFIQGPFSVAEINMLDLQHSSDWHFKDLIDPAW